MVFPWWLHFCDLKDCGLTSKNTLDTKTKHDTKKKRFMGFDFVIVRFLCTNFAFWFWLGKVCYNYWNLFLVPF